MIGNYKTRDFRRQRNDARHRFYSRSAWQKCRTAYLAKHPLCADPDRRHVQFELATEVHHLIDLRDCAGSQALEESNLQGLCKACHSAITMRRLRNIGAISPENISN